MSVTDEQLVEGAVGARELAVGGQVPPGIDAIVAGGRRRVRRRRAAALVPALGLILIGGGTAITLMGGSSLSGQSPAGGGAPSFVSCSTAPTTCDPDAVDAWISEATGAKVESPDVFADPPGIPGGAVYYRPVVESGVEISVAIAADGRARDLRKGLLDPPDRSFASEDPVITRYEKASTPNSAAYTGWGVDAGDGHGAVLVVYAGPAESRPSDADAARLIRGFAGL